MAEEYIKRHDDKVSYHAMCVAEDGTEHEAIVIIPKTKIESPVIENGFEIVSLNCDRKKENKNEGSHI